jgi:hypothetical protein
MDQMLEITEDCEQAAEDQQVIELSTEFLGQVGGGSSGVTL